MAIDALAHTIEKRRTRNSRRSDPLVKLVAQLEGFQSAVAATVRSDISFQVADGFFKCEYGTVYQLRFDVGLMIFQSPLKESWASSALGESGTRDVWRYTAVTTCETDLIGPDELRELM
jgi:hypothetical protein